MPMMYHLFAMWFSIAPSVPRLGPGFQLKMMMRVCSINGSLATSSKMVHGCGASTRLSLATLNGGTWLSLMVMCSCRTVFWPQKPSSTWAIHNRRTIRVEAREHVFIAVSQHQHAVLVQFEQLHDRALLEVVAEVRPAVVAEVGSSQTNMHPKSEEKETGQQCLANDVSARERDSAKCPSLSVVAKRTTASRTARHPKSGRRCRPTSCAEPTLSQRRTRSGCCSRRKPHEPREPDLYEASGSEVFDREVCSSVKSSRKFNAVSQQGRALDRGLRCVGLKNLEKMSRWLAFKSTAPPCRHHT